MPSISRRCQRLRDLFLEQFIASFDEPPAEITLDLDAFDDPAHGQQQLVMFHGYYGQYQYLPIAWTCAENDMVVMCSLLFGTAPAGLGAEEDLELLTTRLREVWPEVRIIFRGDSGIGKPALYDRCEALAVEYSLGLRMNAVLKRESQPLLDEALQQFEETGQKQRLFVGLDYRAGSWRAPRWTIIKVEVGPEGTNRRAILTTRGGARVVPEGAYDAYADRGESDRHKRRQCGGAARNKELKCGLQAIVAARQIGMNGQVAKKGQPQKGKVAQTEPLSQRDAAKHFRTSRNSIQQARELLNEAADLVTQVESGAQSLASARDELKEHRNEAGQNRTRTARLRYR